MTGEEISQSVQKGASLKSAVLVALCHTVWGVSPLFWKQLTGRLPAPYIMCVRTFFTMLVCGICILIFKKTGLVRQALKVKKNLIVFPVCGLMLVLNWGFYILAVSLGKIVEGSLAYFISPLITVVIGFFLFRDRLSVLQWAAVATAVCGVCVSVAACGEFPVMAFLIMIPFLIYSSIIKLTNVDGLTALFLETLCMSPFALAFMIYSEITGQGVLVGLSGFQLLLLPAAGVMTTVPLLLLTKGIHGITYSLSGILTYINPTLEMLIGLIVYGERFTTAQTVTFIFVWAALLMYTASSFHRKERKSGAAASVKS